MLKLWKYFLPRAPASWRRCIISIDVKIKNFFKDEDELTVLHSAAGEGHYAIVATLLGKARWLANEQSK